MASSNQQGCAGISNHSPPLLFLPSSSIPIDSAPETTSADTAPPPPDLLLHQQHNCRKLPDIHHEHTWSLCSHEAVAAPRLSLDLVRDRAGHRLGDRESYLLWHLPEIRRIFLPMNKSYIWNWVKACGRVLFMYRL